MHEDFLIALQVFREQLGGSFGAWVETQLGLAMLRYRAELPGTDPPPTGYASAAEMREENDLLWQTLSAQDEDRRRLLKLVRSLRLRLALPAGRRRTRQLQGATPADYEATARKLLLVSRSMVRTRKTPCCTLCSAPDHRAYECPQNPMLALLKAANYRDAMMQAIAVLHGAASEPVVSREVKNDEARSGTGGDGNDSSNRPS